MVLSIEPRPTFLIRSCACLDGVSMHVLLYRLMHCHRDIPYIQVLEMDISSSHLETSMT